MAKLVTDRFDRVLAAKTVQELEHELYALGFKREDVRGPFAHFFSQNQSLGRLGGCPVWVMCYQGRGNRVAVQTYVKCCDTPPRQKSKLFDTFGVEGWVADFSKPMLANA